MATKKDKKPTGIGNANPTENPARQNFLASHSSTIRKADNTVHSFYYLYDDEDDFTTLGRNISEYVAPKKSGNAPRPEKGIDKK